MTPTETIRTRLFAMQDEDYRRFHAKLIPNVAPEAVIGVRTPGAPKIRKRACRHTGSGSFFKGAAPPLL